jgi:hypothetical protein
MKIILLSRLSDSFLLSWTRDLAWFLKEWRMCIAGKRTHRVRTFIWEELDAP